MKNLTGIEGRLNVTGEELAPPLPPFCPRPAAAGSGLSPDRRPIGDANDDRIHHGRYRGNRQARLLFA
jgi:hypothetical protein